MSQRLGFKVNDERSRLRSKVKVSKKSQDCGKKSWLKSQGYGQRFKMKFFYFKGFRKRSGFKVKGQS